MPVLVFAGLVVATFAAFFVTTRLKRAAPVIEQLTFRRSFSPNGDGRFDVALFAFRLRRSDDVTVSIVTRDGDEVRTLAEDVFLERGSRHRFRWDGRNDAGPRRSRRRVPPARRACATRAARSRRRASSSSTRCRREWSCATCRRTRSRPTARVARTRATLRFTGPSRRARLLVYRTDLRAAAPGRPARDPARRVDRALGRSRDRRRRGADRRLPAGRARPGRGRQRRAAACAPAAARRARASRADGRYVAAQRPAVVVAARARARVHGRGGRPPLSVERAPARRPPPVGARVASGTSSLVVRAPRGRSGVAVLDRAGRLAPVHDSVRGAGRGTASGCWSCCPRRRGRRATGSRRDGDGYPDVLPGGAARERPAPVRRRRPAARVRRATQSALLGFLDRERLRYDITTDLVLAQPGGPPLDRYSGVLFAGAAAVRRRAGPAAAARLRAGRRPRRLDRPARLRVERRRRHRRPRRGARAGGPTRARRTPFGERVRLERQAGAASRARATASRFFAGVPAAFGPFGPLEESLAAAARRAAAGVGRHAAPSVRRSWSTARTAASWRESASTASAARCATSPAAERIMRRLWVLLSR